MSLKWLSQLFFEWQQWFGFWGILSQYLMLTYMGSICLKKELRGENWLIFWVELYSSLNTLDIPKEKIDRLTTGTNIKPGQKFSSQCMARLSSTFVCLVMTSLTLNQLMIFQHWTQVLQLLHVCHSSLVKSVRETGHLMLKENVATIYDNVWFLANVL